MYIDYKLHPYMCKHVYITGLHAGGQETNHLYLEAIYSESILAVIGEVCA